MTRTGENPALGDGLNARAAAPHKLVENMRPLLRRKRRDVREEKLFAAPWLRGRNARDRRGGGAGDQHRIGTLPIIARIRRSLHEQAPDEARHPRCDTFDADVFDDEASVIGFFGYEPLAKEIYHAGGLDATESVD